jgi:DNA-binding transcriptional ArsR family regulator
MNQDIDSTLAALADPTRRGVIQRLRARPHRAGELADSFSMSRPAMSRHLRILRRAGLVEENDLEDDARVRLYRLRQEPFLELRAWLDDVEGFWIDQLEAFKEHVERSGSA